MAGQGVQQRTGEAIGFPVNLHDFRHAAATFWSIQEPANVRGAEDLLGHSSLGTTEKYHLGAVAHRRTRSQSCHRW